MEDIHKLDLEKRKYASVLADIRTALKSYRVRDIGSVLSKLKDNTLSGDITVGFNSMFSKSRFSKGMDKDKIVFLKEFASKDLKTENRYKDAFDKLIRIVDLQIRILKGSASDNKKVVLERLKSEKEKLRTFHPSLFCLLEEPMSKREFLRLGKKAAIASGIVLLEPYLRGLAYAGEITHMVLGDDSWVNDWIRKKYETFKPKVEFVWKVSGLEITREQAETLIMEAMALAHYYLHREPKKRIRVIAGSKEIQDMLAGYAVLENTIHLGRLRKYARKNIASVVLMGCVLHETVHFIDNNYNFSHSIENKAVLKRWALGKSLPRDKHELEKRIDYAMRCLLKTELHAMNAEKKFYKLFLKEGKLDPRDTRIIRIAINGVEKHLKEVHHGTYTGFQELRNLRQAMLKHF